MSMNSKTKENLHEDNKNMKKENSLSEINTQSELFGNQVNDETSINTVSLLEKLDFKKDQISNKLSEVKEKISEKLQLAASLASIKSQHLAEEAKEKEEENLDHVFSKMKNAEQEIKNQFS